MKKKIRKSSSDKLLTRSTKTGATNESENSQTSSEKPLKVGEKRKRAESSPESTKSKKA